MGRERSSNGLDAAFTSTGLNYFTAVVPKVEEFNKKFVENGKIKNLKGFRTQLDAGLVGFIPKRVQVRVLIPWAEIVTVLCLGAQMM
ncbi:MAG: hypothetical protein QXL46_04460 [Nitrososphaerales archaeon]